MTDLPIKIRGLSEPEKPMLDEHGIIIHQEKAFIASSWAHKERANPVYFWVSKRAMHYQFYLGVVCMLLDSRPDLFHVAYNTDNPGQVLGWVARSNHTVLQGYVKEDFRQYDLHEVLGIFPGPISERFQELERLTNDTRKNQVAAPNLQGTNSNPRKPGAIPPG